jgi:hypothetical protein
MRTEQKNKPQTMVIEKVERGTMPSILWGPGYAGF